MAGIPASRRFPQQSDLQPARSAFAAVVSAWVTMILISTLAYLATGATSSFQDALFESVAGFTATGFTAFEDVESLPRGLLLWRASTQWMGGYASLVLLICVLPIYTPMNFIASAREGAKPVGALAGGSRLRELLGAYCALTLFCGGLYAAAGMGAFDAVTYAFTTASTGGFANHAAGLSHFGSASVEWAAVAGMAAAGVSITAVWWALRGRARALWHSFELRVYLVLMLVAVLVVWGWSGADGVTGLRHAAFSVTSAMSSTGLRLADWASWSWGLQFLLLAMIATGGMSGSAGGGFRLSRAVPALQYAYRELVIQLHPNTVHVVKLGRKSVSEGSLSFLNAFQVLLGIAVLLGAFGLALAGADLLGSVSGAISALATMGPAMGDLAPGFDAHHLGGGERGVLMGLMFLGRLMLYPVLITLWVLLPRLWRTGLEGLGNRHPEWKFLPQRGGRRL